jgi:hypothetical protein
MARWKDLEAQGGQARREATRRKWEEWLAEGRKIGAKRSGVGRCVGEVTWTGPQDASGEPYCERCVSEVEDYSHDPYCSAECKREDEQAEKRAAWGELIR